MRAIAFELRDTAAGIDSPPMSWFDQNNSLINVFRKLLQILSWVDPP